MNIFNTNQYINERVKIKPITNAELDKVKQDIENMNKLIEIDNPVFDDICTSGNVVEIVGGTDGTHHGIVIPPNVAKRFFDSYRSEPIILTAHNETSASYWTTSWFKTEFPLAYNAVTKIEKVYSTNIDVNKLKDPHDVWEIYKRFNLQFI